MARQLSPVLLERTDNKLKDHKVLKAKGLWAVVYNDNLIATRVADPYNTRLVKYCRTTFPNITPATKLAKRLNEQYETDGFTVKELIINTTQEQQHDIIH